MTFHNLRAEISEIQFKIEVYYLVNEPMEFSSEARGAEVISIPIYDDVLKFGEARFNVKNFSKGGMVRIKIKSRHSITMSPEQVTTDKPKIAIVASDSLHNYF